MSQDPEDMLKIPVSVVTKIDISRLVTEMEQVDGYMTDADARSKTGVHSEGQPVLSEQLADFLAANNLELGDSAWRIQLIQRLRRLKESVPAIHMTFASPADNESLRELVDWLRRSIHPQSVIVVGLQPALVGGVYIRTANQVHDLSLRARLAGHRHIITREVEALRGDK